MKRMMFGFSPRGPAGVSFPHEIVEPAPRQAEAATAFDAFFMNARRSMNSMIYPRDMIVNSNMRHADSAGDSPRARRAAV